MSWSCSCCMAALTGPPKRAQALALCSMGSMSSDVLALLLRSSHSCRGKGCSADVEIIISRGVTNLITKTPDTESLLQHSGALHRQ